MIATSLLFQYLAALPKECDKSFFGIPPWYKYVPMQYDPATHTCSVTDNFKLLGAGTDSGILLVGLAVLDMLLRLAGMAALAFVIWGGIKYMTSQGEASELAEAKHTVLNALIGLVVAMVATSVVVFVGRRVAG